MWTFSVEGDKSTFPADVAYSLPSATSLLVHDRGALAGFGPRNKLSSSRDRICVLVGSLQRATCADFVIRVPRTSRSLLAAINIALRRWACVRIGYAMLGSPG